MYKKYINSFLLYLLIIIYIYIRHVYIFNNDYNDNNILRIILVINKSE